MSLSNSELIHCLDLTYLESTLDKSKLFSLVEQANHHPVAAFCTYLNYVPLIRSSLNSITIATVVNFPSGSQPLTVTETEIKQALELGIKEIDIVLPYQSYLQGKQSFCLDYIHHCQSLCNKQVTLKVIIESGIFSNLNTLDLLCQQLVQQEIDFIKTSTGKIETGATTEAVEIIAQNIKNTTTGLKISGGIKSKVQAEHFAKLATEKSGHSDIDKTWFRIGASSLLAKLTNQR